MYVIFSTFGDKFSNMTESDIQKILSQGEGVSIEFKKAKTKVPSSLYETVVSFANTNGGVILLGVNDDGTVLGIAPELKSQFLKDIATALNSIENINPVMYLNPTAVEYQGKIIVPVQVPASSQVHNHKGRMYIREYETDIDITDNQHTIRGLFLKKGTIYTETHIYPGLKMLDMDESLFDKARNLIRSHQPNHPWLAVDNMQMLRDAVLYWNDYEQSREGFSLAAALIFGKDLTIQNLLPAYKVEAMVRIRNKDRWDDRLTLRTNLIDTYLLLNTFINRYLPDKFYLEGNQRIDLREKIFREVIGNIICHREYTDGTATELIIEEDAVRTLNPNNPWFNGVMNLETFSPHPKNPNIRRFFNVLGWADEIGSGIRNTKKYLPLYVENAAPIFIDEPLFRTIIPLARYTMSDFADKWFRWLELDKKWRERLTESLARIEINGELHKMNFEELVSCLALSWIEKMTKLAKKVTKLEDKTASTKKDNRIKYDNNEFADNHNDIAIGISTITENGIRPQKENRLSSIEKVTKLPNKRLKYYIIILFLVGMPVSIEDLIEVLSFNHRTYFNENYIKPLLQLGFIRKTIPDKPNAPNQKYLITEQGKRFLTGQEF
jgi:ATP-dependent DNA helicase RecG